MSEDKYVIIKRELYYRPDNCGYTGVLDSAGLYTADEAVASCTNCPGVTMMLATDAPRFSAACYEDVKEETLCDQIDRLEARNRALVAALGVIVDYEASPDFLNLGRVIDQARAVIKTAKDSEND